MQRLLKKMITLRCGEENYKTERDLMVAWRENSDMRRIKYFEDDEMKQRKKEYEEKLLEEEAIKRKVRIQEEERRRLQSSISFVNQYPHI